MKDITIGYIGGGSRGWAWTLMADLALEPELRGTVKLYGLNYDASKTNEAIGNSLLDRSDCPGKWRYRAVREIGEALEGADIVVASIFPGSMRDMEVDVHAPEEYGIWQSVGDTTGPGGIFRALRAVPMYAEIAHAVRAYCPDAWVVNYTNPMAACVSALYEVYPGIKAIGCCHEVFSAQRLLAAALADRRGIRGVPWEDIAVNPLGVNHFTWFDRAYYRDMDLLPLFAEFADAYFESGFEGNDADHRLNAFFACGERVKFDLFRRYGLIAAAGDRHLAEFIRPGYLKDPATARSWKFDLTPVSWRMAHGAGLAEKVQRLADGRERFEPSRSGEVGVRLIKALAGGGEIVSNVNLPNRGQIEGLPLGAVVETNAYFAADQVRPIAAGRLPPDVEALVVRHAYAQRALVRAALEKNRRLAFSVFAEDPLVTIDRDAARSLFDRMMAAQATYFTDWK